jgi:hypothetical protein
VWRAARGAAHFAATPTDRADVENSSAGGLGWHDGDVATDTGSTRSEDGPSRLIDVVLPGSTFGIGSLPHLSAGQAAQFAFDAFDIPTVPSLPRRSPSELEVAQTLIGVQGVSLGQYGAVAVDCDRLDPDAQVSTDLGGAQFIGLRAFLAEARAREYTGPVKWQLLGPISAGIALLRVGASPDVAFGVALQAVRSHAKAVESAIAAALPESPQLAVFDEPMADGVMSTDFPIAPDHAIDLLSGAMAILEPHATVGVHSCAGADIAALIAAGPHVLSVPIGSDAVAHAGYIDRFLATDGWIAWGAVATGGPIGGSSRAWQRMSKVFCELVQAGCDRERLSGQCFVTPECGLGSHGTSVAQRVVDELNQTSLSLVSEASTARFVLGA